MPFRHIKGSVAKVPGVPEVPEVLGASTVRAMAVLVLVGIASTAFAQQASVQTLLERGDLQQAVDRAQDEDDNPEATFLAAQAFVKMDNRDGASEQYRRLQDSDDEDWEAIGESGVKLLAGDLEGAREAAAQAVDANPGNPYARYQLASVASRQNDFEKAAAEFERAAELKPDFAYAHYYAGLAHQRLKNTSKMSEHFNAFLRLAPDAPERSAVTAILRTLRGR